MTMGMAGDPGALDYEAQLPDFGLWVEGAPVTPAVLGVVLSLSVTLEANQPGSFSLQLDDPELSLIDVASGLFAEGKRLEIALGYVGQLQRLISGEITAVAADLDEGGGLTVRVEGFDELHVATRGTAYRQYRQGQTDSEIVQEIASELGLQSQVDSCDARTGRRLLHHASRLQFLQELAINNGFQLWVEGKTLHFQRERPGQRLTLARGKDIIALNTRLSTAEQVAAVEVRGWDADSEQAVVSRAAIDSSPAFASKLAATGRTQLSGSTTTPFEHIILAEGDVRTLQEASVMAEAHLLTHRRALLHAEGRVIGNAQLQIGTVVKLQDMGRFSGDYVVNTARHELGPDGYRTFLSMRQHL